jgi:hypothetical protein
MTSNLNYDRLWYSAEGNELPAALMKVVAESLKLVLASHKAGIYSHCKLKGVYPASNSADEKGTFVKGAFDGAVSR